MFKMKQENQSFSYPKPLVAWATVATLSLTYMFSIIDRSILTLLVDPMKEDLGISDTQVSMLTGFAFAAVYAITSLPMGRVSDLWSRKYVIFFGVTVWSLLTIACGFARNFTHIFVARMGVGFGEAALTPTVHAMMPDLFPPERLARGMSVFVTGGLIGSGLALLVGGAVVGLADQLGTITLPLLGAFKPWQMVLLIVGGMSLLVLIPLATLPEPERHRLPSDKVSDADKNRFSDVLRYLWQERDFYIPFIIGFSLIAMMLTGIGAWLPSYFIRVLGWSTAETGSLLGMMTMTGMVLGGIGLWPAF